MLIDVLMIIAQLCQISGGSNPKLVAMEQAQCHKYYVNCLNNSSIPDYSKRLNNCILGKKSEKK